MPITIQCPNAACNASANVADAVAGRGVKCKKCGTPFKAVATLDGLPSETKPSSPSSSGVPFAMLPAEFGRYRVLSLLGQGGMGAVYLAEDTQLGRKVALKLPGFDVSETKRLERFVREAKSSAGLQHPNICAVFDAGVIAGRPFISMAYINGKTLDDEIDHERPMEPKRAVEIVRKIALALQDAHENGIVHRDLKPANVMMSAKGEPVVMDFGLAKNLGEFDERESKLTQQGAVMGTPSYMSPEQVRGDIEQIGPATDIYALGVMLFELLTGRTPYGGSMGLVLARILTAPVPPLREFRPDADVRLEAICQQAMAKDIAERPASMAMLAAQLGEYLKHADAVPVIATLLPDVPFDDLVEELDVKEVRTRKTKPPRWPMIVGAAVFGLLLVVVGILLTVRTKYGDVVIELSDTTANVELKVDGDRIDVMGLDKPLTLTAGEHGLTVGGVDFETVTKQFTVKKGDKQVVKVTLQPKVIPKIVQTNEAVVPPSSQAIPNRKPNGGVEYPNTSDGFVPLFNGKDLAGWDGLPNMWQVQGDAIVGKMTAEWNKHTFLCSTKSYTDFEIRFQAKLLNGVGNSGFQVRSKIIVPADFVVAGPQIEIDAFKFGGIYGERTSGKFLKQVEEAEVKRVFNPNALNDYIVRCVGKRMTLIVNGTTFADEEFPEIDDSGIIAFQLHGKMKVEELTIKNAMVKDLSKKAASDGFTPLFNGKDLAGWTPSGVPKWTWANGQLLGSPAPGVGAGILMTDAEYDDFELELQYRIGNGAGSGLFLRADVDGPISGAQHMEVQIIDDEFPLFANQPAKNKTGSVFATFARKVDPPFKKNDWNAIRVVLVKRQIQVWVNGTQTIDADLDSAPARDNYAKVPGLLRTTGRIGLQQNQKSDVEFRDLKVKRLDGKKVSAVDPKLRRAFKNEAGDWAIVKEELVQRSRDAGSCTLMFGDTTWKDYDFSCEVLKISGRGEIGQVYRVSNEGRSEFMLGRYDGSWESALSIEGTSNTRLRERRTSALVADRWYKMEVRLRGDHYRGFLDGEPAFDFKTSKNPEGGVGVRSWRTAAKFRNFRVTDPNGKLLFEGLPELPATTVPWIFPS